MEDQDKAVPEHDDTDEQEPLRELANAAMDEMAAMQVIKDIVAEVTAAVVAAKGTLVPLMHESLRANWDKYGIYAFTTLYLYETVFTTIDVIEDLQTRHFFACTFVRSHQLLMGVVGIAPDSAEHKAALNAITAERRKAKAAAAPAPDDTELKFVHAGPQSVQ